MPVMISMLRAVNVGGHAKIKMEELRGLYLSLKFATPQTYVQSGNVIFRTGKTDMEAIAKQIQAAIERKFGCEPDVVMRTTQEMRQVIANNPFANRRDIEPGKLHVTFLTSTPGKEARALLASQKFAPEELSVSTKELYIYFPNGAGKSKLPWARIDKMLGTRGTSRNWNSVNAILEIAKKMELAKD
jgi:uncharacterized protein (DUF1697 family)